jgi:regulatory protein
MRRADQPILFESGPRSRSAVITEIRPLPSDPNMRRIRVGRNTVATLRAADIEALGIAVDANWTPKLAREVQHVLACHAARKDAFRILGRRAHSRAEIIQRLRHRGHGPEIAESIADELAADRWIDDEKYARDIVEQAIRTKPAGRRLLEQKMRTRKIDPEVAARVLGEAAGHLSDVESAAELAKRGLRGMRGPPPATIKRRLAGLMLRRGFDEEVVDDVLALLQLPDVDGL